MTTNITDEGDRSGTTETTLVSSHDRSAQEWARSRGAINDGLAPSQEGRVKPPKAPKGQVHVEEDTVDEVVAAVDAGTLDAQTALDAERAGKNRSTLISQLESRGAS